MQYVTASVAYLCDAAARSKMRDAPKYALNQMEDIKASHDRELKSHALKWFYREGAGELDAADLAINAAERGWRESFGAGKPVAIDFVDAVDALVGAPGAPAPKYNSLVFPADPDVESVENVPGSRPPMVETSDEFGANWHAITLGLCTLWDDLPLFAAGGAALAALHRWPAVIVPPEVAAGYKIGDPAEEMPTAAKFAREFAWAEVKGDAHSVPESIYEEPPLIHMDEEKTTIKIGRQYTTHAGVHRPLGSRTPGDRGANRKSENAQLGLMAFMSSRYWPSDQPIVEKFISKDAAIQHDGDCFREVEGGKAVGATLSRSSKDSKIHEFLGKYEEYTSVFELGTPCTQIYRRELLYMRDRSDYSKGVQGGAIDRTKRHWLVLDSLDTYDGHDEEDNKKLRSLYGLIRVDVKPLRFLAPLHLYAVREHKNEVLLRENVPEVLMAIFPLVVAELCHSYVGMDVEDVLEARRPRTRVLQSFRKTDIDLFLITRDPDEATKTIVRLHERLRGVSHAVKVVRTANAVTFVMPAPYRNVQVILRLYHTPQQVLLGFDVDCCAVGVEVEAKTRSAAGVEVARQAAAKIRRAVTLPRGARALATRQNLVDPTRLSTTFEARLLKYARRGFAIAAPGLARALAGKLVERADDFVLACKQLMLRSGHSPAGSVVLPLFDEKTTGVVRLAAMLYVIMHNRLTIGRYQRRNVSLSLGSLNVRLGFHGGASDYDTVQNRDAEDAKSSEIRPSSSVSHSVGVTRTGRYAAPPPLAALFDAGPIRFRAEEPHGQDRKTALFTGSFNPVAADWYHVPETSDAAKIADSIKTMMEARLADAEIKSEVRRGKAKVAKCEAALAAAKEDMETAIAVARANRDAKTRSSSSKSSK